MNSSQQHGAGHPSQPRKGARILYVDDEEALAHLARRMLSRMGYRVTVHTDPLQALEAFRQQPQEFALVITDLSMPKMSGLALAKELRALRVDIPIALTSGYTSPEDEKKAAELGIHHIIAKPATLESMGAVIKQLISASGSASRT